MGKHFTLRRAALAALGTAALGAFPVAPALASPLLRCDTQRVCPVVVYQTTYAHSTPYTDSRGGHVVKPGTYAVTCEADTGIKSGRYQNSWWSRTHEGTWINNGDLKGGVKMNIGDCKAPPNDGGGHHDF